MPSTDDLSSHAASTTDFYQLLSLPPTFTKSELDRARRKAALKYHPDKVGPEHTETFLLVEIGYEILGDDKLRSLYDSTRAARARKAAQDAALEGRRRNMKEDLERRERGAKRTAGDVQAEEDEAKLQREMQRLAEDGRRRKEELAAKLRKDLQEEQPAPPEPAPVQEELGDLDRSIKVRFARNDQTNDLTTSALRATLGIFGPIEDARFFQDRRVRVNGKKEKRAVGIALIVYQSIVGAHTAVADWRTTRASKPTDAIWSVMEDVNWASGTTPSWAKTAPKSPASAPPSSQAQPTTDRTAPTTPKSQNDANGSSAARKQVPTFASFSSTAKGTGSPFTSSGSRPSMWEETMLRLKDAQRRKEEAERSKPVRISH